MEGQGSPTPSHQRALTFLAVAVYATALLLALHLHFDFNLEDEGFLWHGAQQVLSGAAPSRDFRAYEPGRYYWTAWIFALIGSDNNSSARLACALFGGITYAAVTTYLHFLNEEGKTPRTAKRISLIGLTTALCVWTFPYYRVFDTAAAAITFATCVFFLRSKKSTSAPFLAGCLNGLIFFIGRNHALYALISLITCTAITSIQTRDVWQRTARKIGLIALGMATTAGLLFLIQELARPGSLAGSLESWISLIKLNTTNMKTNWPWSQADLGMPPSQLEGHLVVAIVVCVTFGIAIGGGTWTLTRAIQGRRTSNTMVATVATTLGYLHCVNSRPDLVHIATSFIPVIVGAFTWAAEKRSRLSSLVMILMTYCTARSALREQVAYQCLTKPSNCTTVNISVEENRFSKSDPARAYRYLSEAIGNQKFLAIPAYTSLYAIKRRKAPGWAFYEVWPSDRETQLKRIEEIKQIDPKTVVVKKSESKHDPEHTMPWVFNHIRRAYQLCDHNRELGIMIFKSREISMRGCL